MENEKIIPISVGRASESSAIPSDDENSLSMVGLGHFDEFDFYREDPVTGKIIFDKNNPGYQTAKGGLALAGIDIDTITTVDDYEELTSIRHYGMYILDFIEQRYLTQKQTTIAGKAMRALVLDDHTEVNRLNNIGRRANNIGLSIAK